MRLFFAVAALLIAATSASAAPAALDCNQFHIDPAANQQLAPTAATHPPGSCHMRHAANGMQLPDPLCTPGAVNPTVTGDVLRNPKFRTTCVRDKGTSADAKRQTYVWYGITPPANNATGATQICELDHLVSIGLGGSDDLANIWPQCGPANVQVGQREFKVKDAHAELGLMRDIKAGADLPTIQRNVAQDWTQFIVAPGAH
jgi:hypothetical protein